MTIAYNVVVVHEGFWLLDPLPVNDDLNYNVLYRDKGKLFSFFVVLIFNMDFSFDLERLSKCLEKLHFVCT